MELVYLWVEEYKNIKNQGFNFSPRFECEFFPEYENGKLKDDSELKITPKDYVSIFTNNINVTAIVGENGSGKSSILELLAEIFRIEFNKNRNLIVDNDHTFNFSLVFKIKNKTYKIKSINGHDTNTFNNDEKIKNILDYYVYSNDKDIENKFLFDNTSIAQMLVYNYSQNKNFKLSSFMYLPSKIEIRLCDFTKKFEKLIQNDILYPMYRNESDSVYIENTSQEQQSQIENFKDIENKYYQFLILKLLESNEEKYDIYLTKETIEEKLKIQNIEFISEDDFNKYFKISNEIINRFKKEVTKLTEKEKEIYINKHSSFFEFDFIDEQNRSYSDLSHGEKTLFGQLLNIYYNSQKSKNNNLLFLFDEPEIALHPQWQKNYINEIYNLVERLSKNYHFIFTSHSPFILSDIPKENVIFLEKYKENDEEVKKDIQKLGNCRNISKHIEIKTFGANIHTLLSNGFFMSDGLMGEFAKSKINEIKDFYDANKNLKKEDSNFEFKKDEFKKNKKYFKNIQKIIGEPFLKTIIKNYLDELEILFYGKKEFLNNEIKRLQDLQKSLND